MALMECCATVIFLFLAKFNVLYGTTLGTYDVMRMWGGWYLMHKMFVSVVDKSWTRLTDQ